MNHKLEQKLFKKYPGLFRQKDLSMKETAMCRGIDTSDYWYSLIDNVCGWISYNVRSNPHMFPIVEFTQIKSKFGTLRLYTSVRVMTKKEFQENKSGMPPKTYKEYVALDMSHGIDEIDGAISFAEYLSGTICELCGKPGHRVYINHWYYTACPECTKELKHGTK